MRLFKVSESKIIGKNTLLLTISPKRKRDAFTFQSGQYAAIGFKHNGRPSPMRCFSIVSSPNDPQAVQFAMRIQGDFTNAVSELKVDDTVFLQGPFGDFALNELYDRNVIMLAGGIGITPFMSMARYAAQTNSTTQMTLLYSCSFPDDIPFMDELIDLEKRNPRFKVAFFITQGPVDKLQNIRRLAGRISEDRLKQLTNGNYDSYTYFVCGPKQFTESLSSTLLSNKVAAERIITEEFTPSKSVNNVNTEPRYSITRWTYGLTGATLLLATGFFMFLDLSRFVPRSLQAQAAASPSQSQTTTDHTTTPTTTTQSNTNTTTTPDTTAPSSTSNSTQSTSSSNNSSSTPSSSSSSSSTSTPSTTQTYQQPVTSVS
jgi:ferredoxin-NADP reductase